MKSFFGGMLTPDGKPSRRLWLFYLLLQLVLGLLTFPVLLLTGAGDVADIAVSLLRRLLYAAAPVFCSVLFMWDIRLGRSRFAYGIWGVLCLGAFISSFTGEMLVAFDTYLPVWTLDAVLLTGLTEALLDTLFTAVFYLLLLWLFRLCCTKRGDLSARSVAVFAGCAAFLDLVFSEIPSTVSYFVDYGATARADEILYMIAVYVLFAAAGYGICRLAGALLGCMPEDNAGDDPVRRARTR